MYYYLDKSKNWQVIENLIYPITSTFGIDEALDTSELSFIAYTNFEIAVDCIVKQTMGEINYYWVVKDLKSSNFNFDETKKIVTLSLIEGIDLLRGFKLAPCVFKEKAYTFNSIVQRLCEIAQFNAQINTPNIEYENPKLTYPSSTLYLALFELGKSIDCIPYLDFNEETKEWIICFQRLDGLNGKVYNLNVFNNPTNLITYTGEGLAKKVYSEVSNLRLKNEVVEPNFNFKLLPEPTDETDTLTNENMGLELRSKISEINTIIIYGFARLQNQDGTYSDQIDYDYPWVLKDQAYITYYTGYESDPKNTKVIFITDEQYQLLTDEEKALQVLYIRYKDNIIYLSDLLKIANSARTTGVWITKQSGISRGFFINDRLTPGGVPVGDGDMTSEFGFGRGEYKVYYNAVITDTIPIVFSNNSNYDDCCYYNQTSQQVDADKIGKVLQSYINNMSNGSIVKSGTFNSWGDIPLEGSIIKNNNNWWLIDSVTIEEQPTFFNVDAQLVGEHSQRRENIEASTELQLSEIPNTDLVNKLINDVIEVYISIGDEIGKNNPIGIVGLSLKNLINYPVNEFVFHNRFRFEDNTGTSIKESPFIFKVGNSILFHERAKTNLIWDETTDSNNNVVVTYYTDQNAKYSGCNLYLGNNYTDGFMTIYKSEHKGLNKKDPYEIFDYTLQLLFKGYGSTIVRELFVEEILTTFPLNNGSFSIKLYNYNIGEYDIPTNEIATIDQVSIGYFSDVYSKYDVTFNEINTNYKCFVLFKDDRALLIKNYIEEQNKLSPFSIYLKSIVETISRDGVYTNEKE